MSTCDVRSYYKSTSTGTVTLTTVKRVANVLDAPGRLAAHEVVVGALNLVDALELGSPEVRGADYRKHSSQENHQNG